METKIKDIEERIKKLENLVTKLERYVLGICVDEKNDVYITEGTFPTFTIKAKGNIHIENSKIDALSFEGEFQDASIITSNIHNLSIESSEQTDIAGCSIHKADLDGFDIDDLECRTEDIKCSAEDAKAILDEIEPRINVVFEKLNNIKSEV